MEEQLHRICRLHQLPNPRDYETVIQHVNNEVTHTLFEPYGSFVTGLALVGSDLDLSAKVELQADTQAVRVVRNPFKASMQEYLLKLQQQLKRMSREGSSQVVLAARVPVLSLVHDQTGIKVDISVNNDEAVQNSKQLRSWLDQLHSINGNVLPLCCFIKYWSHARGIDSAADGTLSAYAHLVLVLHSLVSLSQCHSFDELLHTDATSSGLRGKSLTDMLLHYFQLYVRYPFSRRSVRLLSTENTSSRNEGYFVSVQDPCNAERNLGDVVDQSGYEAMQSEWKRASYYLSRAAEQQQQEIDESAAHDNSSSSSSSSFDVSQLLEQLLVEYQEEEEEQE